MRLVNYKGFCPIYKKGRLKLLCRKYGLGILYFRFINGRNTARSLQISLPCIPMSLIVIFVHGREIRWGPGGTTPAKCFGLCLFPLRPGFHIIVFFVWLFWPPQTIKTIVWKALCCDLDCACNRDNTIFPIELNCILMTETTGNNAMLLLSLLLWHNVIQDCNNFHRRS